MERPLLCVLVDAFRHDYLTAGSAPFLAGIAAAGPRARMRPIHGYSDSIRATIFTGSYPDQLGYWMEYCYRPETAAMAPLARLGALDRLPGDLVRRGIKFTLSQTAARALAGREGYDHLSLRHLPFRSLDRFDWTLRRSMTSDGALGSPTIFDRLTSAGVPWSYLDSSRLGRAGLLRGLGELPRDTQLVFVYLHHIDMASHVLGIDSRAFRTVVRRTDALVGRVVEAVRGAISEPELVVFSDHGMSRVQNTVSYPDLWAHPSFPDRFCFALDATMVRLWWLDDDERLRQKIRGRVRRGAPGRFLAPAELRELHLDFGNRLYGDEIYLLEPGTAIFPNFHSMLRPRAMHAYHPDDPDQQGIFLAPGEHALPETVELTAVTEVCLRKVPGTGGEPRQNGSLADAAAQGTSRAAAGNRS
jgi:hypothetical protein